MSQDPDDERQNQAAAGETAPVAHETPAGETAPVASQPAPAETPAESPAAPASEGPTAPPLVEPRADPLERAQQKAKLAEDRLGEVLTAYRQAKVDNEAFRDRVNRDIQRQVERHSQKLVLRFIEVLDNLDRALESAEQAYAGNPLIEGLILVRSQLLQILQKEGLERVPVLGLPFDPASAEAVGIQPVTDPDHDHVVVKELLRGYRLHERLARASRVLVGVYREPAPPPSTAAGSSETAADGMAPDGMAPDLDPAASTIRLDDRMLREIFRGHEPETKE